MKILKKNYNDKNYNKCKVMFLSRFHNDKNANGLNIITSL